MPLIELDRRRGAGAEKVNDDSKVTAPDALEIAIQTVLAGAPG